MLNNIILKASAGTGKTYRLSLEFIANLVRGVNYKNIVVMTFTKKATAEIKERIFDFLYQIAFDKGNGAELEKNLKEIYKFDNLNKKELQNIYFEMIKNKEDIRISTIDRFTNQIFKNAIAPYFNIYNYEIFEKETDEFYSKVLIKIKFKLLRNLFSKLSFLRYFVEGEEVQIFNEKGELIYSITKIIDPYNYPFMNTGTGEMFFQDKKICEIVRYY